MPGPRRLNEPRAVAVRAGDDGAPRAVAAVAVEAVREEWLVEDRWWTPRPLRRHYFELAMADGRALTVFRDPDDGRWYRQRA
ncbi:MAG TPA: hypothetical protein VHA80_06695 [Solirubrobacterales bacterium]|jgi:hypothetical protein|nr:hypothetical protein [Solirubrobacterales bacterium]